MDRLALRLISAALLAAPCAFSQAAQKVAPRPETVAASEAPAQVTEALRSRVDEFFQYHVQGGSVLRKAFELVAEDTKDFYFASQKMKPEKFVITDIKYAPGFDHAMVVLDVTREWNFSAQEKGDIVTLPMVTYWKMEEGQWRWYMDRSTESITPMGFSNAVTMGKAELLHQNPDGTINLPADFNKPETLAKQAELILKQSKLDKSSVTLSLQKQSEATVTFINGYGDINLEFYGVPEIPGLSWSLEKSTLRPNEDGVLHFRFDPPPASPKPEAGGAPVFRIPASFDARLVVEPFNQIFSITVNLDKGSQPAQ